MSEANGMPVIEFAQVCKTYRSHRGMGELIPGAKASSQVRALDDISFRLARGRVLGLVGESGSGKSTLANVLVGLEAPTSGRMLFEGRDLAGFSRTDKRAFHGQVQMVFQDPYASLNPRFTIRQTVEEPLIIHRHPRHERTQRVIEALERSELRPGAAFLDKYPHELSGGQRQRVAIARAIVLGPSVLVADEPVSMLDVSVRAGILRLLRSLIERLGMALVFITHDLSLIGQICDDLMILYRGKVAEFGPAVPILDHPRHPYTQQLMAAVPVPDARVPPAELPAQLMNAAGVVGDGPQCNFAPRCIHTVATCRSAVPLPRRIGDVEVACHRVEELGKGAAITEK
ncbi:oligopeptide/dipeptide ABC transporter ATP-binding protein [Bradyrhizobium sp. NP1]|uniref:ABC transporter ATP-binding protein n=1 Tax=Bradyrhizobium sp. NP1 TaxID=3049772 RepID=UPI0025A57C6D|nr:oligopeptide/dipeptide ABC transporter ATP-binding protein [Bradyrhizobium sp. NP1]WJR80017.1 ATP-binding cassette domain-containing protein [Bradyrhizobium sp. NP1]